MRDVVPRIRELGADIAVIGSGNREQAAAFRAERALDMRLFVDPELRAFAAAELRRGARYVLDPRALANLARAVRHGYAQGRTQGDQWQQGGAVIVAPPGEVLLHFISRMPGDHVPPEQLLDALGRARG